LRVIPADVVADALADASSFEIRNERCDRRIVRTGGAREGWSKHEQRDKTDSNDGGHRILL
jgi:hypothetical protein